MRKFRLFATALILVASCVTVNASIEPFKKLDFGKVTTLFQGDIVKYYKVDKKLIDSPLKEKKFMESSDYKALQVRLKDEQESMCHNQYYVTTKVKSQYDLNQKTFTFELPSEFKKKLSLQTNDKHFNGMKFTTPKMDEDTAYRIEMGESSFEVVVRLTGEIYKKALECVPVRIYVRNKAGQILYEYEVPTEQQTDENE